MWRTNTQTNWVKQAPNGRNTSLNFIDIDNVDTFATYTLSSSIFSLQSNTGKLTAINGGDKVLLEWTPGIEFNGDRFIIERSSDNISWYPISSQPVKEQGFTLSFYNYTDDHPNSNEMYYRVREIDINTDAAVTNTAKVSFMDKMLVTLTPNPVVLRAKATVTARNAGNGIMSVFALDGKRIIQQQLNLQAGINQVDINTGAFAAGMYYLVVEMKDGTKKMVPFTKQ